MASEIPQEIINAIVDSLAEPQLHRPSLLACTLVSRSFSHPARRHLFSTISIRCNENRGVEVQVGQLLSMIGSGSDLRHMIKRLYVEEDRRLSTTRQPSIKELDDDSGLFKLLRILNSRQCSLKALHIYCSGSSKSWPSIGTLTQAALAQVIPHLTYLRLRGLQGVPFSILADMPAMETLEICRSTLELDSGGFSIQEPQTGEKSPSLGSLVSLRVDKHLVQLLENFATAGLDFPTVQDLQTVISDSVGMNAVWNLIGTANFLVSLELKLYTDCSFMMQSPFDLGRLIQLRSVCIRMSPLHFTETYSVPHALNLLYPPTRPTSITNIKVALSSPFFLKSSDGFVPPQIDSSWAILQPKSLLEVHPSLKSVEVEVDLSQSSVKWTHALHVQAPTKAGVLSSLDDHLRKSIFGSEDLRRISSPATQSDFEDILKFTLIGPNCLA